ncbi:MAG: VOC family protein [Pyrinomonadaceae bacterium]
MREDQFIPHLIVSDGLAALEFYKEVFGAGEGHNMMSPDETKLMHGEIILDGHKLFVSDWFAPSDGGSLGSPASLGGTCVRITLMVDDADAVFERAVARGSSVIMPVQDMFWGARYGKLRDPFGHEWGVNQQLAELTSTQTELNAEEFFDDRQTPNSIPDERS